MFTCERCDKTTDPSEPATKIPVVVRKTYYPSIYLGEDEEGNRIFSREGRGQETVLEVSVCADCSVAMEDYDPRVEVK